MFSQTSYMYSGYLKLMHMNSGVDEKFTFLVQTSWPDTKPDHTEAKSKLSVDQHLA